MKITCDTKTLSDAFQTTKMAVPNKTPKDILKNVLLQSRGDGSATLTATDMEIGVVTTVNNIQGAKGSCLVPAAKFGQIIGEATSDTVVIDAQARQVNVKAGRGSWKLPVYDEEEYPPVTQWDDGQPCHTLQPAYAKRATQGTLFATDTETSRYALGGVSLDLSGGDAVFAATDSRRLAVCQIPCVSRGGNDSTSIVPKKALQILDRCLNDKEEELRVSASGNEILFNSKDTTVYSRLLEGRFPKWRDVVPDTDQLEPISMIVGPLLSAVKQGQIVTSEESKGLKFTFTDGLLSIEGRTAGIGDASVDLPVAYNGQQFSASFDPKYMVDFLRFLKPEDEFFWFIQDEGSASVMRRASYTYVLMPMAND